MSDEVLVNVTPRETRVAIVENPDEAYASAMPNAALEATPSATVMTHDQIVTYLSSLGTAR